LGISALIPLARQEDWPAVEKFDGTLEQMTYQQQWIAPVTISFYGSDAWSTATTFALLIQISGIA